MSWALPFLFMQLLVKAHNAAEFLAATQGSLVILSVVSLALFCLFVYVLIKHFPCMSYKEKAMPSLKGRSLGRVSG